MDVLLEKSRNSRRIVSTTDQAVDDKKCKRKRQKQTQCQQQVAVAPKRQTNQEEIIVDIEARRVSFSKQQQQLQQLLLIKPNDSCTKKKCSYKWIYFLFR